MCWLISSSIDPLTKNQTMVMQLVRVRNCRKKLAHQILEFIAWRNSKRMKKTNNDKTLTADVINFVCFFLFRIDLYRCRCCARSWYPEPGSCIQCTMHFQVLHSRLQYAYCVLIIFFLYDFFYFVTLLFRFFNSWTELYYTIEVCFFVNS